MHGTNAIAKRRTEADGFLVHSIWYTLQGEGPWAGLPAVFLRLAGCNLACSFCDTEFEQNAKIYTLMELCERLKQECDATRCSRIVITGGEPMLQPLTGLILFTEHMGLSCQIETSGTAWPDRFAEVVDHSNALIVVSPKTPKLHPFMAAVWWRFVCKYIIQAGQVAEDGLPIGLWRAPHNAANQSDADAPWLYVYVQPCDEPEPERTAANMRAAVASALAHGHRLSLQLHKIAGVP